MSMQSDRMIVNFAFNLRFTIKMEKERTGLNPPYQFSLEVNHLVHRWIKTERGVCAGVHSVRPRTNLSTRLGQYYSVFPSRDLLSSCTSQDALLQSACPHLIQAKRSCQFNSCDCWKALNQIAENNEVHLCQVLGHQRNSSNETADALA